MKVQQLKQNSLIKLEFSPTFYKRLQDLVLTYTGTKEATEIKESYRKIANNEDLDEYEHGLETLLILVNSLETAAHEQNLVEDVELPNTE